MIKLKLLLEMKFINLFNADDKRKYADDVWDILKRSYAPIGGFHSAKDKEELIQDSELWKLIWRNGKVIAVGIYKDMYGRKAIAKGSDGSPQGIADVKKIIIDDVKMNRAWGEFSQAPEHLMLKNGAKKIPNIHAEKILNKKIISLNPDGYHYTRIIGGKPHEKIILGNLENIDINDVINNT